MIRQKEPMTPNLLLVLWGFKVKTEAEGSNIEALQRATSDGALVSAALEQAARALAEETYGGNIPRLQKLVKKVLKMRQLRGS